ncbi:MAG: isochorismatase family protein [Legionellaceae bacterium]|nr:isochorismatase family protein [Legionellaceae bacterium]
MNALLIIDMQLDFMSGGPLAVPSAEALIPVINRLQPQFDVVVATQDWHPLQHNSFIVNDANGSGVWPVHCVQGTSGASFHPLLETHAVTAIIRKGMNKSIDSYSAFYDNDHVHSTGLAGYLREQGVKRIYFCGLCADICVYFSIKDALQAGFECVLIEDATCALDADDFQVKRGHLLQKGVISMLSSDNLFNLDINFEQN